MILFLKEAIVKYCIKYELHQITHEYLSFSDELGYLVDAIVNEDKIDSFDSRPNNMSLEVNDTNTSMY